MSSDSQTTAPRPQCPQPSDVVEIFNANATSDILLVCEHASNFIPSHLNNLGINPATANSHAAWDLGALNLAKKMSEILDATVIAPTFSRLVYDCNRPEDSPSAMPTKSEIYEIPGNLSMSPSDRQARIDRYYLPYKNTLSTFIDQRIENGHAPILVTIHSFTQIYHDNIRKVEFGIIHDDDSRLSDMILKIGPRMSNHIFRRNDPYGPEDGVTHTLVTQAQSKGLLNAMVEIRNDLITDDEEQTKIAETLADCIIQAIKNLR